ncbi:purine-nucleoside phosphorylase [Ruminococcus sp.]|uniref:purine-nucleoside phosphorylase n=1 Tax=Ruminococcus sp. TaxID=41978 RepID=UPI0025FF192C|nr:purine-nucleoside phosphorylase [Ruminococcus sp.]MCI5816379.1 purine-nucleoside phosphorylase [Ruminococcus sp.]MDY4962937.1 purine-nucleoside phosphorylase [Ruminococcus callidus]
MATPHNQAEPGQIAPRVLMPGDPLRAQFIAEHYLENPVCYNRVRNMLGFTGTYKGVPVSVQGSGMGMPSIGIYSYELFHHYNVQKIIRVGTAGGISPQVQLRDIVLGQGACTNSSYANQYGLPGTYAPIGDFALLEAAAQQGRRLGLSFHVGNLLSSDTFYDDANSTAQWQKMNVLAVEMEAAALYMNAARAGKQALCIATVSDLPLTGASTSPQERQESFTAMMELALETIITEGA